MCNRSTGYCDGSCQEAQDYWAEEDRLKESVSECPYRKECTWITVNVKQDKCTTCGKVTNY